MSSTPHHIHEWSTCHVTKTTICPKVSILLVTTCTHTLCTSSTPHSLQPHKHCNLRSKKSGSFKIFLTSSLYFRTWTIFSKKFRTETQWLARKCGHFHSESALFLSPLDFILRPHLHSDPWKRGNQGRLGAEHVTKGGGRRGCAEMYCPLESTHCNGKCERTPDTSMLRQVSIRALPVGYNFGGRS